ncbi:MAG: hypothetical protein EA418_12115, partial [Wenzhouxiangellaceae bacterium]
MPHSNEKIDRLRIRDDDSQAETRYWPWAAGLVALVLAAGVCVWWWSSPGLAEVRVVEPRQVSTDSQGPAQLGNRDSRLGLLEDRQD